VSQSHQKRRSTLAVYISRRTRKKWLNYSSATLATLAMELPGKRLAWRIGSWRGAAPRVRPQMPPGASRSDSEKLTLDGQGEKRERES
jgi:hypothetical protein